MEENHIKEMQPYAGIFLIAMQALVSLFFEIVFPPENPFFRICVSPYLVRKKSIASLDLLEHKALEVVLVISGLGWRNLEPGFRIVPQRLQVVTNPFCCY
jgi:hypothetical protein